MDRKDLTKTGDRTDQFFGSRFGELGNKHGPIYWLLAPKKAFDRDDVDSFLDRLPCELHGRALRRAIGAWHDSFATLAFVKLARE